MDAGDLVDDVLDADAFYCLVGTALQRVLDADEADGGWVPYTLRTAVAVRVETPDSAATDPMKIGDSCPLAPRADYRVLVVLQRD